MIDARKTNAMSRAALARVGLELDPDTPIKRLSVAQRQMVEIAKALSLNARIVIMDEPTSALTDRETRRLFEIIRALRAEGRAIIYISHRLEEVALIGDRVTVLRDGRKVGSAEVSKVEIPTLISMMVGRDLKQTALRATAVPGAGSRCASRASAARACSRDIDLRLHAGRDRRAGRPGRLGPDRAGARHLRRRPASTRGEITVDGRPVRIAAPADADAARHRLRDRGPQAAAASCS